MNFSFSKSTAPKPQERMSAAAFQHLYGSSTNGDRGVKKDPKKVYQGMKNKANGERFENVIKQGCEYYRFNNEADVSKSHEALKVIGKLNGSTARPTYKAVFTEKGEPDFKGLLFGGQAVGFEAKHTDTLRLKKGVVTRKQSECLERYHNMGGASYVVVSFQFKSFFRIPWPIWNAMEKNFGHLYVEPSQLTAYEIPLSFYYNGEALMFLEPYPENTLASIQFED